MNNCCPEGSILPVYRIVQTIYERNAIPCEERMNGLLVTVVGDNETYKQYMLQGGDPCVNNNWVEIMSLNEVMNKLGHKTIEENITEEITPIYLNTKFPETLEGFSVTFTTRNTTFTKLSGNRWGIQNIKIQ